MKGGGIFVHASIAKMFYKCYKRLFSVKRIELGYVKYELDGVGWIFFRCVFFGLFFSH